MCPSRNVPKFPEFAAGWTSSPRQPSVPLPVALVENVHGQQPRVLTRIRNPDYGDQAPCRLLSVRTRAVGREVSECMGRFAILRLKRLHGAMIGPYHTSPRPFPNNLDITIGEEGEIIASQSRLTSTKIYLEKNGFHAGHDFDLHLNAFSAAAQASTYPGNDAASGDPLWPDGDDLDKLREAERELLPKIARDSRAVR